MPVVATSVGASRANRRGAFSLALALGALTPSPARAFLFEEHANIGRTAVGGLAAPEATAFDRLWAAMLRSTPAARARLCPLGTHPGQARPDPTHDRTWTCVDFGAMTAAGGDHSCNPADLWDTLTQKTWFSQVYADVAATERLLHESDAPSSKQDAWHQGNLILEGHDPEYVSRAAKNNAHFLVARRWADTLEQYVRGAVAPNEPLNATAVYSIHHVAALAAAARLAKITDESSDAYASAAVEVLTSEAFAGHFLEDAFAAGHFVGLLANGNGTFAERAGTHDYYCVQGLLAHTWNGTSYGAWGDGFMKEGSALSDREMASSAVKASLEEVLRVAAGADPPVGLPVDPQALASLKNENVCTETVVSPAISCATLGATSELARVLGGTPEPYLDDPSLPHFRSEVGLLVRGDAALRTTAMFADDITGGNASSRTNLASEVALGVGGAAEGLTTHTTDGVFYVEGIFVGYGPEYFPSNCPGCLSPPARIGWGLRARLPFYVVPGDTLFPGALIALVNLDLYEKMFLKAARGSAWFNAEKLLPVGSALTFQLVLGREAAVLFSGSSEQPPLKSYRMTEVELPIVELRTKHVFSGRIGSDSLIQLGCTIDQSRLEGQNGTSQSFAFGIFGRLAFDTIYYFWPWDPPGRSNDLLRSPSHSGRVAR